MKCTTSAEQLGLSGQIEDTNYLTYLNNRYYDPANARFISVNPLGIAA